MVWLECVGENDLEHDEQVAKLERLLMVGHTVSFDRLDFVGLDHLTRLVLYADLLAVKVSQNEVNTSQSLQESYLLLYEEIGTLTLEGFVALLLDLDHHVTCLNVREFVSLPMEYVLLSVGSTLINLDLKDLLLFGDLLSVAGLALVLLVDNLALAFALLAWASALRVHARSKLLHHSPHTSALASSTCHHSSTLAS